MAFMKQLWLLLWKNSLLKRRSRLRCRGYSIPVSVLVEIFWPVFLYIIMAILRVKFKPEFHQDTIYRANALPSAGVLPFMQTLFCDIGSGGTHHPTDMPHYPNASVNEIYSILDELGSWNGTWDSICSSIKTVADQSGCRDPPQRLNSSECNDPASVPLTCVLTDPLEFHDFLTGELGLDDSVADDILDSHVNTEQPFGTPTGIPAGLLSLPPGLFTPFSTLIPPPLSKRQAVPTFTPPTLAPGLPDLEDLLLTPESLKLIACNNQTLGTVLQFQPNVSVENISQALCSLSPSQWQQLSDELQRQVQLSTSCSRSAEQLREVYNLLALEDTLNVYSQFSDISLNFNSAESNYTISEFLCGDAERGLSGFLRGTVDRLSEGDSYRRAEAKHESEGSGAGSGAGSEDDGTSDRISLKVFYTPDNNLTRSIMTKANRTFATAEYIQDWAEQVANCSEYFLENYPRDDPRVEGLRQTIDFLL